MAAEISPAQVVGRRRKQVFEIIVGGGEISMSLGCGGIPGVELTIGYDAGRKSGDGSAGTDSNATRNLAGAAIGHGGGAQDGESLSRFEGLRVSLSYERRQRGEGEEDARHEPETE